MAYNISKEQLILFPLVPFVHHVCHVSCMTEYIAIEDDNATSHCLQVLVIMVIGMEDCSEYSHW